MRKVSAGIDMSRIGLRETHRVGREVPLPRAGLPAPEPGNPAPGPGPAPEAGDPAHKTFKLQGSAQRLAGAKFGRTAAEITRIPVLPAPRTYKTTEKPNTWSSVARGGLSQSPRCVWARGGLVRRTRMLLLKL